MCRVAKVFVSYKWGERSWHICIKAPLPMLRTNPRKKKHTPPKVKRKVLQEKLSDMLKQLFFTFQMIFRGSPLWLTMDLGSVFRPPPPPPPLPPPPILPPYFSIHSIVPLQRNPLHEKSVSQVAAWICLKFPGTCPMSAQLNLTNGILKQKGFSVIPWHSWALCPWRVMEKVSFVQLRPSSSVIPHSARLHNLVLFNPVSMSVDINFPAEVLMTQNTQITPGFWGHIHPSLPWT